MSTVRRGGRVVMWDAGYWRRAGEDGYFRLSIDRDHPSITLMDATPDDPARFATLGIQMRTDADPRGPIVLGRLGRKSRSYLGAPHWEAHKLRELQARCPGREIIYRPKPRHPSPDLGIRQDAVTPIDKLLRGASLVVCRHSNVAVDTAIAGVPFECEDEAAMWLQAREFTEANRRAFACRLAHWQYRPSEMRQAWAFARAMLAQPRVSPEAASGVGS